MSASRTLLLSVGCALLAAAPVAAIGPEALYIYPAGGQRGTTVDFKVGGLYLHESCDFEMHAAAGSGVEASRRIERAATTRFQQEVRPQTEFNQELLIPVDYAGSVRIASGATATTCRWRVWTAQGVTPLRPFVIGDLPEVIEDEICGDPIPTPVELPLTVNGRIYPREDIDIWALEATKGQSITCEVNASRIGSTLDSRLEVRDEHGRRIAEDVDHFGADSFLRFTAPRDGTYFVHIHDIRYGGLQSSVYRLTLSAGPRVDVTYPLGGRRGKTTSFELIGQALPSTPVKIALPAETSDGRAPRGFAPRLKIDGTPLNEIFLDVGELPELLESEPNNAPAHGNLLDVPSIINGRIETPEDVDIWTLRARKDEALIFEFRALRPGLPLDPRVVVLDAAGKTLHEGETRSEFKAPADGTYHLRVEDLFGRRGGSRFVYRLEVSHRATSAAPDFAMQLAQLECAVARGGSAELTVNVKRFGGLAGEIEVHVDGLPAGVTAAPTKIAAGKTSAKVKLTTTSEARIGASRLTVRGSFDVGPRRVTRTAVLSMDAGSHRLASVFLVVTLPTPFKFAGEYELPFALQGTIHYRHLKLDRGGYEGPVHVRLADRQIRHQQGSTGPTIVVPAGVHEFDYPLEISTWTEIGLTSRTVLMAFADIEDGDGGKHTVAYTSDATIAQVMMQPNAGPLSVETGRPSVVASTDGSEVEIRVRVRRDPHLPMPVRVEIVAAAHVRGVEATPVALPPGTSEATLRLRFARDAGPFNVPLVVRATARLTRAVTIRGRPLRKDDPVVAFTRVDVVREQPRKS